MKRKYTSPKIDVSSYEIIESIALDNFFSDPWGLLEADEKDNDEE